MLAQPRDHQDLRAPHHPHRKHQERPVRQLGGIMRRTHRHREEPDRIARGHTGHHHELGDQHPMRRAPPEDHRDEQRRRDQDRHLRRGEPALRKPHADHDEEPADRHPGAQPLMELPRRGHRRQRDQAHAELHEARTRHPVLHETKQHDQDDRTEQHRDQPKQRPRVAAKFLQQTELRGLGPGALRNGICGHDRPPETPRPKQYPKAGRSGVRRQPKSRGRGDQAGVPGRGRASRRVRRSESA